MDYTYYYALVKRYPTSPGTYGEMSKQRKFPSPGDINVRSFQVQLKVRHAWTILTLRTITKHLNIAITVFHDY